jgi:biotin synthase
MVHSVVSVRERLLNGIAPGVDELADFLAHMDGEDRKKLHAASRARRDAVFGRRVYFRGLIEFTSYCACDCFYCGLRRGNQNASRYRLTYDEIMDCCRTGHDLGYRSFVMQGGEDAYFDDDRMTAIVSGIRAAFPDSAITISIGERSRESYQRIFDAGANRCLVRHETADPEHYARLHPSAQTLDTRLRALRDLKEIGYQVGAGFMVGSPYQTPRNLAQDLLFLHSFQSHMIGIGPFIPHHDTPFAAFPAGSLDVTLDMLSITRLLVPRALLPATTALASIAECGRILGLDVGANVVMPNLSPSGVRKSYAIYDNKKSAGTEAAESLEAMQRELVDAGYEPDMSRGDWTDGKK